MASDKPSSNADVFFSPFGELKKQLDLPARTRAVSEKSTKNSQVNSKKASRLPACSNARAPHSDDSGARACDYGIVTQSAAQESEDAALFLSAMQGAPGSEAHDPELEDPAPQVAATRSPHKKKILRDTNHDFAAAPLNAEDARSFAAAMQGVRPVDGKGRDLPSAVKPAVQRQVMQERDYMAEFADGRFEFALEYTEEFFEGRVMGMDPLIIARMRAGHYSPEAHIDLHGLNAEQAYACLNQFIRTSYNQGKRSLVVVTGRGKNSPGGLAVLRLNMQEWLTKGALKRVVLAFCTAQPKDGGAGALYVLLRKLKKSNGKIRWDDKPWEESPLFNRQP